MEEDGTHAAQETLFNFFILFDSIIINITNYASNFIDKFRL